MSDENKNILSFMRFWLVGICAVVFSIVSVSTSLISTDLNEIARVGLPIWGATAGFAFVLYYATKWHLSQNNQ